MKPFSLWRAAYASRPAPPAAKALPNVKQSRGGIIDVANPGLFLSTKTMPWGVRFVAINYRRSPMLDVWLGLLSPNIEDVPSKLEECFNSFSEASAAYSAWLGACVTAHFKGKPQEWDAWFKSSKTVDDLDLLTSARENGLLIAPQPRKRAAPEEPTRRRRQRQYGGQRRGRK